MVIAQSGTAADVSAQQGAEERARTHFDAGASYFEAGSYEDALREFQRAYDLSRRPELFYNISVCHQHLGDLEQALLFLQRYLEQASSIENRANLELRAQNLERRLGQRAPEGNDAQSGARSEPAERTVERTPVPLASQGGGENVGAIVGFSLATVGVVMAGVFGTLTLVEDGRLTNVCFGSCFDDEVGTLRTWAALTDVGFGVAAAGATVGLIFLLVGAPTAASEQASLAPWMSPSGGGLVVRGAM